MTPDEWIDAFLARHVARLGPHDWPKGGVEWTAFIEPWIAAFASLNVTEAEAEAASMGLAMNPPHYRREHLPAVVKAVLNGRRPPAEPEPDWVANRRIKQAQAAAWDRRQAELKATWDAMTEDDRAWVRAVVEKEHPSLVRFEPFMRRLCLEAVAGVCVEPAGAVSR